MAIQHWRIRDRYYRLLGNKCAGCGAEYFPPVYRCKNCGSEQLQDKEMPRTGKIVTHTELHEPLPGFEELAPFHLAVVELTNGVRILTQIVDSPSEAVRTGARARAVFRRVMVDGESGQIFYGYKFVVE
jgi:uncharacterized OB-fold protein